MKKISKQTYILTACCLMIWACASQNDQQEILALRASQIYRPDTVKGFMISIGEAYKDLARDYLKKGEDLEDKDIKQAIWNIKRCITLYPNLNAYKKLGSLLMKDKQYEEANDLYYLLTNKQSFYINGIWTDSYLFEAPNEELIIEYLVSNALYQNVLPFETSQLIEENGFRIIDIKNSFFNDERIRYDTGSLAYKNYQYRFLSDVDIDNYGKNPLNFEKMLSRLPVKSEYAIEPNKLLEFNYENFNGRNYTEGLDLFSIERSFLKEERGKMIDYVKYNFIDYYKLNDSITVLHYSVDSSATACPKEMRHPYHALATYNKKAEIVDYKVVGVQSGNDLISFSLNNSLITCKKYNRKWKKDYNKNDFLNELLSIDFVKEETFKINQQGKFEEIMSSN